MMTHTSLPRQPGHWVSLKPLLYVIVTKAQEPGSAFCAMHESLSPHYSEQQLDSWRHYPRERC